MNIPPESKRRPGRPKATTNALTRQPNETQNANYLELDSDDPPVQEPISKKIRLERTPIVTTQPQLKKKRANSLSPGQNKIALTINL
ncbi:hypothetical protein BpHYR1_053915 [Brachionus plicatilis]|uniref:Uncharacterized protein n=1 Tax=Brachionus plicatilis TaxID=10195 RepID=A0A3M7QCV6_BRAPC|nr:hypothetical protein BpHYR1_053915 [Brachionus plicatilis]